MAIISINLVVTVAASETPAVIGLPVRVSVVPDAIYAGASSVCVGVGEAAVWTAVVSVGGVDRSSMLMGDVVVDAEEGAARIAEFSLRLPPGSAFTPAGWVGAPVTIDVADNKTGSPQFSMRLFSGMVDNPTLDLSSKVLSLRCTDDLQGRCDAVPNAVLLAGIGGYDSPAVFDPAARGWAYAQDRLSTAPVALDISPLGALRVTALAPKATPDLILDESLLGDGSVSVSFAERAALVNQVDVEFDYRIPRVKAECYAIDWSYVDMTNFAQFLLDENWFLQRAQVDAAIGAAGGTIESITYIPLPDEIIAVGSGYFTPSEADAGLCMGFAASVSFDYAQTIDERHRITVAAAHSVAAIGLRKEVLTGALVGEYPDTVAVETSIKLFKSEAIGIPPADTATPVVEKTVSADVTLSEETNREAANAAMRALIAVAKARIFRSHRAHLVSARVPLIPAIDLDKTLRIDGAGVAAQGKCIRVVHRLNADSGEAVSEISVGICSVAGVGVSHPEDPTAASPGSVAGETPLTVHPTVDYHSGPTEDHEIVITFPGVEEAERAKAEITIQSSIAAPLIEDELVISL